MLDWSIGMDWLIAVSYARRVDSEPKWPLVGSLWKETCDFTVLLQTNINWQWSIDRLACIDWLMFLMHAGLAVSRSGRWLALYGKNGVTALEVRHPSTIELIIFLSIVTDPDPQYFAGSWSALKAHESGSGPDLKRFIVFYILNYRSVETLCHFWQFNYPYCCTAN